MIDIWPWWNEFKFGLSEDLERERWVRTLFPERQWWGTNTLISISNRLFGKRAASTAQRKMLGSQAKNEKPSQSAGFVLAIMKQETQGLRTGSSLIDSTEQNPYTLDIEPGTQRGRTSPTWPKGGCLWTPSSLSSITMGPNSGQWRSKGTADCHLLAGLKKPSRPRTCLAVQ